MPHQIDPNDPRFIKYGHGSADFAVVEGYQLFPDAIALKFHQPSKSGATVYLYTYESAGADNVKKMKILAQENTGLLAFVNKFVRKKFAQKW